MFLPWTQSVRSTGYVTTLRPDQRPQTVNSIIDGRIEKWFAKEGDFVNKGDTIVFLSEIKDIYLDPNLVERTESQLRAKELTVKAYMEKVRSLDNQIDALSETGRLKLKQTKNKFMQANLKVMSDSISLLAAQQNYEIAQKQYERYESLFNDGLQSLTDLENRRLSLQKALANKISAENKLLSTRNEKINAEIDLVSIKTQYMDDVSKAESFKFTALSDMYTAEIDVTKLQNQFVNYSIRSGMYFILAPQDGYLTKVIQSGIGETIKAGDGIISIVPSSYQLAVEMYVRPIDLPLIQKGQKTRVQFDGWPAIIFSGWPNTSFGTFGGVVFAIDNNISTNGMYRVLVAPDSNDKEWPKALRVGSGSKSLLLLKNVRIGYEVWRQVNGFPPDFYTKSQINEDKKLKTDNDSK